jgi:hypothetical protein
MFAATVRAARDEHDGEEKTSHRGLLEWQLKATP